MFAPDRENLWIGDLVQFGVLVGLQGHLAHKKLPHPPRTTIGSWA